MGKYQIITTTGGDFIESIKSNGFDLQRYIDNLPEHMKIWEYQSVEVELLSVTGIGYDVDAGYQVDVSIKVDGKKVSDTFYIQLTGGEYLSQMGCWIVGDSDGDLNFEQYKNGIFAPFESDIITAAEKGYKNDTKLEKEGWKFVRSTLHEQCSATSSTCITVEKKGEEYRAYIDNSGFTPPTNYSSMPAFQVEYFNSEPHDNLLKSIFNM